ncbi:MAG: nickel pincer cofactor biosynthesis protein LarB [bacterium]
MNPDRLRELLQEVRGGHVDVDAALERLAQLPYQDLGFARVDHHRALRKGFPEVVYGGGKTATQIVAIVRALVKAGSNALVTRVDPDKARAVRRRLPKARYHEDARALTLITAPLKPAGRGTVVVVSAGTSDQPVAEEAAVTLELMGQRIDKVYDVGVAGLHRLLGDAARLREASVLIVVAGMEGALPSVVAGLVSKPVIAVPTSVGYGASFGGVAALLGMLTSCASGVAVVNIDNGFGAACIAALINRV